MKTLIAFGLLEIVVIIIAIVIPVITLVNIIRSKIDTNKKILWSIIVILLNIVGVILWLIIGRRNK